MIIAMDGPAGAGKSTVARLVAQALGLTFLDTGAMYRAVTLTVQERGVAPEDAEACAAVASALALGFDADGNVLIDGRPGEPRIRMPEVTQAVSIVSAHPSVRAAVVARQRELAARLPGVVAEGRDTTTVVFPDADLKLFLTASPHERARRRAEQEGRPTEAAAIQAEIERRDHLDSSRAHSPLREASDAVRIETDGLAADQVVQRILGLVAASGVALGPDDGAGTGDGAGARPGGAR